MVYELVYIIPAKYTDTEVAAIQTRVTGLLQDAGAKILRDQPASKLKMSYPIKHQRYGHYVLAQFEAAAPSLVKIQTQLGLSVEAARFSLTAAKPTKGAVRLLSHEEARLRAREERQPTPRPAAPTPTVVQAAPTAPAMSQEELDKKLDELLNEQVA